MTRGDAPQDWYVRYPAPVSEWKCGFVMTGPRKVGEVGGVWGKKVSD
jgi:hypothetical protein